MLKYNYMGKPKSIIKKTELSEDALDGCTNVEKVSTVVVYLLQKLKVFNSNNSKTGTELYEEYGKLRAEISDLVNIQESSFAVTLSKLAHDQESVITKAPGKKGYFLDVELVLSLYGIELEKKKQSTKLAEKDLYPVFYDWLEAKGCDVRDVASKHPGETWRNPDVIGIRNVKIWGKEQTEVISIEVKKSLEKWPIFLFEAVSHSMFANRAYFAFLLAPNQRIPDELKAYAAEYHIGLLALRLSDSLWNDCLNNRKVIGVDENDEYEIEIVLLAPYHVVDPIRQVNFLQKLEINGKEEFNNIKDKDAQKKRR